MSLFKKSNKRVLDDIKNLIEMSQTNKETIHLVEINELNILGPHYVCLKGPSNTPYENGIFKIKIVIPDEYPFKPPTFTFVTKIYHPNISLESGSAGTICIDILKNAWSYVLKLSSILLSISVLLENPNPDDPLESEIATQYTTNKKLFESSARNYTKKYSL